ncbi:hypothetical protein [uncultured Ruegeria sp.]|uniref:hypothetical protein n=1 Tax=uncultured Ruegeria sp. TaxID=259304 RepID=UPI002616AC27|nr:hypothetical protein [uncultured Ruegeria sp.]
MSNRCAKPGPGEGPDYDRENDHTYLRVLGQSTDVAFATVENNLKASIALGLHCHDSRAEMFCILEGEVDFLVDGGWYRYGREITIHGPDQSDDEV